MMFQILYSHYLHYIAWINMATDTTLEGGPVEEPPPYLIVCQEILFNAMRARPASGWLSRKLRRVQ